MKFIIRMNSDISNVFLPAAVAQRIVFGIASLEGIPNILPIGIASQNLHAILISSSLVSYHH